MSSTRPITCSALLAGLVVFGLCVAPSGVGGGTVEAADPRIDAAVGRGMAYLRRAGPSAPAGYRSLAALGLAKCGEDGQSRFLAESVRSIQSRITRGEYRPEQHHFYEAGIELMLLQVLDAARYQDEMNAIRQYVVGGQAQRGSWYYPQQGDGGGDTSISQYAMLGLWAASSGGLRVPPEAWDRAAGWHVATQREEGGWVYHPGSGGGGTARHSMTAAGVASLWIARMHLYPNARARDTGNRNRPQPGAKFGVLEQVEIDAPVGPARRPAARPTSYTPRTSLERIDDAIEKGIAWLTRNYTVERPVGGHRNYYLYGLERAAALADLPWLGDNDWYADGSALLLREQQPDGSWSGHDQPIADTSFALLFLTRATARQLDRPKANFRAGGGLLAGGRGLPDNLTEVDVQGGEVRTRKLAGPLDELLAGLENPDEVPVESVQAAIVEAVQVGDRETLVGQTERLVRLVKAPDAEVRRTAAWALGRGGELRVAPLLIDALADPHADVAVEAHNALCYLARKPRGVDPPSSRFPAVSEEAGEDERKAAVAAWRERVRTQWRQWYLTVRPYDERDDLSEVGRRQ